MLTIGDFIRITHDTLLDEPLVAGMVAKVVADVYFETDPTSQALVVVAGARKPCAVSLNAVEVITELDYGEDVPATRDLWRQRNEVWRQRHGAPPRRLDVESRVVSDPRITADELLRRMEAVGPDQLASLAEPALVPLMTEWSMGALDMFDNELPSFGRIPYHRARAIRVDHVERWLWDGVRLYLAIRGFHSGLPALSAEPSRERVRFLFERREEGEAAERIARFCLDAAAFQEALLRLEAKAMERARGSFAKRLKKDGQPARLLAEYILQLHVVGFQVAYCADFASHPPLN